jgi:DNA polymerase III subunit delta
MGGTRHVFDFLDRPAGTGPVVVVFGDEPFLKQLALNHLRAALVPDDDEPLTTFDGPSASWADVSDGLRTVSLFHPGGPRTAVVRDADGFVQEHRPRLEKYVDRPEREGVLVLEVSKWASNTRLYKLVDQQGLQIECRVPQVTRGKQKVPDESRVVEWLIVWARKRHEAKLTKTAAKLLVQLVGPEFGLLDQSLAKLALFISPKGSVTDSLVRDVVGGWQAKTAWDFVDAAVAGDSAEALLQLDRLLQSGEPPQALFGSISWSLRRFAAATRIYQRAERQHQPIKVADALEKAGFFKWQHEAMRKAERHLKQLGRDRASQLHSWLLETDLALKGSHSSPDLARLTLEHLVLRMDQRLRVPSR